MTLVLAVSRAARGAKMASGEAIMTLIYFSEAIFLLRRPYLLQNIRSSSNGVYFCDSPLTAIDSTTIYYITLYNNNKNSVNKQHILLLSLIRSSALHPRSFDTPHSMTCIFLDVLIWLHLSIFACLLVCQQILLIEFHQLLVIGLT